MFTLRANLQQPCALRWSRVARRFTRVIDAGFVQVVFSETKCRDHLIAAFGFG
jgi:hypothetical protein